MRLDSGCKPRAHSWYISEANGYFAVTFLATDVYFKHAGEGIEHVLEMLGPHMTSCKLCDTCIGLGPGEL